MPMGFLRAFNSSVREMESMLPWLPPEMCSQRWGVQLP